MSCFYILSRSIHQHMIWCTSKNFNHLIKDLAKSNEILRWCDHTPWKSSRCLHFDVTFQKLLHSCSSEYILHSSFTVYEKFFKGWIWELFSSYTLSHIYFSNYMSVFVSHTYIVDQKWTFSITNLRVFSSRTIQH